MRSVEGYTAFTKPWYGSYHSMMDRCYRSNSANYKYYGGRGIKVCEEWKNVKAFGEWAEKSGYMAGLSLDRIDPSKDYSPDNCRWATPYEQANNRRNTVYLTANGETHTISEWANITGIKQSTIKNRIYRGWSHERALTRRDFRRGQIDRCRTF